MKLRKILALMLTVTMVAPMILTGCSSNSTTNSETTSSSDVTSSSETVSNTKVESSSDGSTDEKVSISFWTLDTRQECLDAIVGDFEVANPNIDVELVYASTDGHKQNLKIASSSGTLPSMWFNWGGSLGGFYTQNGLTYDLTSYAEQNKWNEKFQASALDLSTLDGKLSGFPTSLNVIGMYYRKDLFEKCGLEVPTTFEEFENVCAVLKENGITPLSTGGQNGWHVMRFVELLIEYYAGAELHDSMNVFEESYNNEAVIKALTKYKEFCDLGYFPEGFVTANPNDALTGLYSGACAMDTEGQWADGKIVQEGQDMSLYGYFPFPSGGDNRLSAFAEMIQFNANLSEAELEACMAFASYYNSQEIADAYPEFFNLPIPQIGATVPESMVNVETMLNDMNTHGIFTITDQAFPTEVADALFAAQDAIATVGMTPEEGASTIQAAIEAYQAAQ